MKSNDTVIQAEYDFNAFIKTVVLEEPQVVIQGHKITCLTLAFIMAAIKHMQETRNYLNLDQCVWLRDIPLSCLDPSYVFTDFSSV